MRTQHEAQRSSIVDPFHEPALRSQVLVDAIQRGLVLTLLAVFRLNFPRQRTHLNVPFIPGPHTFRPPVAFSSPRTGKRTDLSANAFTAEKCRLPSPKLDARRKRRPVDSHGRFRLFFSNRELFLYFRQNKTLLLERIRTMRVEQYRRTCSAFPDQALDSREGDFKTVWIGRKRQEQSQLSQESFRRCRQHVDGSDG